MNNIVIPGGNDNYFLDFVLSNADPSEEATTQKLYSEIFERYGLVLLMQKTSHDEITDLNGDLPTDCHLVRYIPRESENIECDAVRSYSKSDIFDAYHDLGCKVLEIKSGYGTIKPKLFVNAMNEAPTP